MDKVTLKEAPIREDFKDEESSKNDKEGCLEEQVQPLPKDWKYASSHPKELIISEVSKGVSTRSNVHNLCGFVTFISHIEHRNVHEAKVDSYGLLAMQEELNQFERKQVWRVVLSPKIDQLLILSGCLETSWMSRVILLETRLG